jgi:PncC family amidohydrolase
MNLINEIQALFVDNRWTLSTAESCTGGAIAASLTEVPGASEYFLGSIVAYSNDFKHHYLHVPKELIKTHGAVSKEVAVAMVQGLIHSSKADFGIAVTGVAGPSGGTPQKPVGTVWVAVMHKDFDPEVKMLQLTGSRSSIISGTVEAALLLLYKTALNRRSL